MSTIIEIVKTITNENLAVMIELEMFLDFSGELRRINGTYFRNPNSKTSKKKFTARLYFQSKTRPVHEKSK